MWMVTRESAFVIGEALLRWDLHNIAYIDFAVHTALGLPNVEMIRSKEGAARAPHETCLTKESDPVNGLVKNA
jgi:hypothetical protein